METVNANTVIVPPGKYVLGDPCYAVHHNLWDSLLSSCETFDKPVGSVKDKLGYEFQVLAFFTAYGDGQYGGNDGYLYGVDSGLIGLVPFDLAMMESWSEGSSTIVEFENPTVCSNENGILTFGRIVIDTVGSDDYTDEEETDSYFDDEEES